MSGTGPNDGSDRTLTIAWRIGIGFALAIALMCLIGSVAYRTLGGYAETTQWVQHSHVVIHAKNQLHGHLDDAETGQRGFLITGFERYLAPYRMGKKQIPIDLARLRKLTDDNPAQQRRLDLVVPLVEARLALLEETIALRRGEGFEAALAEVLTDKGRKTMVALRTALADFGKAERVLLDSREANARDEGATARTVLGMGIPLSAFLLLLVAAYIIRGIRRVVNDLVSGITSATAEILAVTVQQASGGQEQVASCAEMVATLQEVAQTSEQAAERAKAVGKASQRAAGIATNGREAVEEAVESMTAMRVKVDQVAQAILALAEQAQTIGDIIASVSDIADQTNLLALNASIEAARAGEHGRGFAVVASEVRVLAEQSKLATSKVRNILGQIESATNRAVLATEEGTKSSTTASEVVSRAGDTIRELARAIADAAGMSTQIAASANQQVTGSRQISQAMVDVDQVARQSLASTQQTADAVAGLQDSSMRLQALMIG
ncbi:CHASE3 domain-containing protein [Endomicrobium sp. AH-315-J14]|nr:CHASE3 domain-containing protein [Endomicrobium sp. AH-315-J14]